MMTWLFIGYLCALIVGDRTFAYWHIPIAGMPVYVTEMIMAAVFIHLLRKKKTISLDWFKKNKWWSLFYACAAFSFVRGVYGGGLMAALRDSAMVYYSLFFFIAPLMLDTWKKIQAAVVALFIAVLIKIFLVYPQMYQANVWYDSQAAALSMYLSVFFLFVCACAPVLEKMLIPAAMAAGLAVAQVTLYQVRTTWLALGGAAIVLALTLLLSKNTQKKHVLSILVSLVLATTVIVIENHRHPQLIQGAIEDSASFRYLVSYPAKVLQNLFPSRLIALKEAQADIMPGKANVPANVYAQIQKNIDEQQLRPSDTQIEAIAVTGTEVPMRPYDAAHLPDADAPQSFTTVRARLYMWGDMLKEMRDRGTWVFGTPFGQLWKPPSFWYWDFKIYKRIDPHNSVLAIFYRIGVFGLFAFLAILATEFWKSLKTLFTKPLAYRCLYGLFGATAASLYCLLHSLTDVTLENPFKGIWIWVFLGISTVLRKCPHE